MPEQPPRHGVDPGDLDSGGEATSGSGRFRDLVVLDDVDSTNRVAVEAARDGAPEGLVVVADHQSTGRGRLGRTWLDPGTGALLCSVLLRPGTRLPLALGSVVVGLAAIDAIDATTGTAATLKWPNDVMIGEAKVAGILAEQIDDESVVVGIGMNLSFPPGFIDSLDSPTLHAPATTVELATGHVVGRDDMRRALLRALEIRYSAFLDDHGANVTIAAYREHLSTLYRRVRVEVADGAFDALAIDVADDGRLVVERAGSIETLAAADVVHLR